MEETHLTFEEHVDYGKKLKGLTLLLARLQGDIEGLYPEDCKAAQALPHLEVAHQAVLDIRDRMDEQLLQDFPELRDTPNWKERYYGS